MTVLIGIVFSCCYKNENESSSFNEVDSIEVNMLRFVWILAANGAILIIAIISGENNTTAKYWVGIGHLEVNFSNAKIK